MNSMNLTRYVLVAIISLGLTSVLTTYLNRVKPRQIEKKNILEMPKLYLILSNVLFVLFGIIEFAIFFDGSKITTIEKIIYGLFGFFLCFGGINTLLLYL